MEIPLDPENNVSHHQYSIPILLSCNASNGVEQKKKTKKICFSISTGYTNQPCNIFTSYPSQNLLLHLLLLFFYLSFWWWVYILQIWSLSMFKSAEHVFCMSHKGVKTPKTTRVESQQIFPFQGIFNISFPKWNSLSNRPTGQLGPLFRLLMV